MQEQQDAIAQVRAAATARANQYADNPSDEQLRRLMAEARLYHRERFDKLTSAPPMSRQQFVNGLKSILKSDPQVEVTGINGAKTVWIARMMDKIEEDPRNKELFDEWVQAWGLTHTAEITPFDAWNVATVYSEFAARWIDVREDMPDDGMSVVFCCGNIEDPKSFKFGAGTYTKDQFYADLQSKDGAGVPDVICWRENPLPQLMVRIKGK